MTNTVIAPPGGAPSQLIAREIRAELARQQLSNRRLALALGVSSMWVNRRISACETELTFEDLERIGEVLDVPVEHLMAGWLPQTVRHQGLEPRTRWLSEAAA